MAVNTVLIPPPASALQVLQILESIDADGKGEPTRRKLEVLDCFAKQVRDYALAEFTLGLQQSGLPVQ